MPEINPVLSGAAGAQQTSAADNARTGLADTFDTFLTLLTNQLKHQDPLDPLDSNEFVSQLVQFTSVEQQIATNRSMENLLQLQAATAQLSALHYIGKVATISSNVSELKDGAAKWQYELPRDADTVTLTISDKDGRVVRTLQGEPGAGAQDFEWDGTDSAGNALPDGPYVLEIAAKDTDGETIKDIPIRVIGEITGVDLSNDEAIVEIGQLKFYASRVIAVRDKGVNGPPPSAPPIEPEPDPEPDPEAAAV
jgi:flagellar basal-body rod modification protein FlgD